MKWNITIGSTHTDTSVRPVGFHKHDEETTSIMGKILLVLGIPFVIIAIIMFFI